MILDAPEDGQIEFSHHAQTREEFIQWTEQKKWNKLLRYLKAPKDGFINIPSFQLSLSIPYDPEPKPFLLDESKHH